MQARYIAQQTLLASVAPIAEHCPFLKESLLGQVLSDVSTLEQQQDALKRAIDMMSEIDINAKQRLEKKLIHTEHALQGTRKHLRALLTLLDTHAEDLPKDALIEQFT